MPVDPGRRIVPVSGTAIRAAPLAHWAHLPPPVRAHYARRVCIVGAESTGKSTLAAALASHYQTTLVPEYARTYLEALGRAPVASDMPVIATNQLASEDVLARSCNRVLICDTDVRITRLWSDALFGACDPVISQLERGYDLTIATGPDVPFEPDPIRYLPEQREAFHARIDFADLVVTGDREARLRAACVAIDQLLA